MSATNPQDSLAAMTIPGMTLPLNLYIRGPKYSFSFDRIIIPKVKEKEPYDEELEALEILANAGPDKKISFIDRTWRVDIRQTLADNMIKDMHEDMDRSIMKSINDATRSSNPGDG